MFTARDYLELFVGQARLKNELQYYMEAMENGTKLNILLMGLSGYGKTFLGDIIFNYVRYKRGESYYYYLCNKSLDSIQTDRPNVFLDEAHLIVDPEFIYPHLDSGQLNFIIATNEYYTLKEPLSNRCVNLQIEEYSVDDLQEICRRYFEKQTLTIPEEFAHRVAEIGGFPREVLQISKRLYIIFGSRGIPENLDRFNYLIKSTLGLSERGNISLSTSYTDLLRTLGGQAGIETIVSCLGLPKQVILNDIEPALLRAGVIQISSKGRKLNG